jgi:hypothetical protein
MASDRGERSEFHSAASMRRDAVRGFPVGSFPDLSSESDEELAEAQAAQQGESRAAGRQMIGPTCHGGWAMLSSLRSCLPRPSIAPAGRQIVGPTCPALPLPCSQGRDTSALTTGVLGPSWLFPRNPLGTRGT